MYLLTTAKELSAWINGTLINTENICPSVASTMLMTLAQRAQREFTNSVRISMNNASSSCLEFQLRESILVTSLIVI